jgi:hypothetical protein
MHEKSSPTDHPGLSIWCECDGWHQVMDVRVKAQVAGPGLQHANHADLPAQEARVVCQLLERGGRGAKQECVNRARLATRQWS